jgi:gentisate 1,2-dioxygenase
MERNRNGVLFGNEATPLTASLTHTLWALFNALPARVVQKAHRHNSVALDLCVSAGPNTYTLMSDALDARGELVNPVRADWKSGAVCVSPPGLWHSHHNESDVDAIVLPIQDAALHTWMRTLDIRFT